MITYIEENLMLAHVNGNGYHNWVIFKTKLYIKVEVLLCKLIPQTCKHSPT